MCLAHWSLVFFTFSLHYVLSFRIWLSAQRPNGRKILSNVGGKLLSSEKSTDNISKHEYIIVLYELNVEWKRCGKQRRFSNFSFIFKLNILSKNKLFHEINYMLT